ncbi:hypothetical protein LX36DRAFT_705632 [Colletotrichum falcatum]|nr:hypothetical protein LX36DRAFT_705632 [Colletotrichum falcatum]
MDSSDSVGTMHPVWRTEDGLVDLGPLANSHGVELERVDDTFDVIDCNMNKHWMLCFIDGCIEHGREKDRLRYEPVRKWLPSLQQQELVDYVNWRAARQSLNPGGSTEWIVHETGDVKAEDGRVYADRMVVHYWSDSLMMARIRLSAVVGDAQDTATDEKAWCLAGERVVVEQAEISHGTWLTVVNCNFVIPLIVVEMGYGGTPCIRSEAEAANAVVSRDGFRCPTPATPVPHFMYWPKLCNPANLVSRGPNRDWK